MEYIFFNFEDLARRRSVDVAKAVLLTVGMVAVQQCQNAPNTLKV